MFASEYEIHCITLLHIYCTYTHTPTYTLHTSSSVIEICLSFNFDENFSAKTTISLALERKTEWKNKYSENYITSTKNKYTTLGVRKTVIVL